MFNCSLSECMCVYVCLQVTHGARNTLAFTAITAEHMLEQTCQSKGGLFPWHRNPEAVIKK